MNNKIDKLLFYQNNDEKCKIVLDKIKEYKVTGIKFVDVYNPNNKIPNAIVLVPAFILTKDPDRIYLGYEIIQWIELNYDYSKIESNDIRKKRTTKEYKPTKTLTNLVHTSGVNYDKNDDDIFDSKTNVRNLQNFEKHYTENIKKRLKDKKIDEKTQKKQIDLLLKQRNDDITKILEKNALF